MMNVSKGILFSSFFRRNGISKRRIGIHSQTQFCKIIKRERAGADRNGHVISLILFHICDTDTNSIEVQDLTCVLLNRIRLLDEVGWFESNRLGVLLPYTSRDGAQKLANDICKTIKIKASSLEYTIYSYPSEWFSNRRRFQSLSNPEHLPSKYKTMMSQNLSNSEENAEDSNRVLESQRSSIDIVSSFRVLEQSIKPFFNSPLPTWKRALDVVCALLGLIILSPFFLIFALIIKMQSPGPVFFKQKRIGYSGRILTMWKFRTMYCCDNECDHQKYMFSLINSANQKDSFKPMIKQDKHYNITKFGKILRKT
ncbi:sugar transferase, partial [Planctomycetota bacterium]